MDLSKIAIYPALEKGFFDLLFNINCDAECYVGCTNVKRYFDIDSVKKEKLVEIGFGVKVSRPVVVKRGLKSGEGIFSSLSHNGVLAIYCYESGHKYQLTDLVKERQMEIEVENFTHTGFYDESMVVLTYNKLLGVCSVEEMFSKKNVGVLKGIGDVEVHPSADVSLLHSTRVLAFISKSYIPHEFNVDTGVVRKLEIGKEVYSFASLMGIDVGARSVFMENGSNQSTFSLNNDFSTSLVLECNSDIICVFIPSSSNPRDLKKGMKIYDSRNFSTDATEKAYLTTPFRYQDYHSIVRLYQDIFLVYDGKTSKWCLVKILVP